MDERTRRRGAVLTVVGIVITEDGPAVDPLAKVSIHPAAELFPLMQGAEFDDLVTDIREHGQRDAIVMTPDGQLLDGRNRWRACAAAGITPVTRVERSEPWAFVISTNVHRRHLNESQRAMIGARIAQRPTGFRGHTSNPSIEGLLQPPTTEEAARLLNVGRTSIERARHVAKNASPTLVRAVESGAIPVYTASRVARELPTDQQDEFAHRVANGADAKKLAAALDVPSDWVPVREDGARTDNLSPRRHQHLTVPALRSLRDSLDALDLVLRNTAGLDPALTSEEAARWVGDLSKGRGALRRVVNLLNERKESNQ